MKHNTSFPFLWFHRCNSKYMIAMLWVTELPYHCPPELIHDMKELVDQLPFMLGIPPLLCLWISPFSFVCYLSVNFNGITPIYTRRKFGVKYPSSAMNLLFTQQKQFDVQLYWGNFFLYALNLTSRPCLFPCKHVAKVVQTECSTVQSKGDPLTWQHTDCIQLPNLKGSETNWCSKYIQNSKF